MLQDSEKNTCAIVKKACLVTESLSLPLVNADMSCKNGDELHEVIVVLDISWLCLLVVAEQRCTYFRGTRPLLKTGRQPSTPQRLRNIDY
jgi:hypothetical protein